MNELTPNTINFCRHHTPFRSVRTATGADVHDNRGLTLATCRREDDAWTIAEALNEIGKRESGKAETKPTPEQKDQFWANA